MPPLNWSLTIRKRSIKFLRGDHTMFNAGQFVRSGGLQALAQFTARDAVFEALRQTCFVRQSAITATVGQS